ncbi:splicing factor, proline- and glutamine-rich-like [Molothrus ater]|uniref:splicing factor, proline- and glutamine-rich-like n=1 Tax=Molothrus ater TaxID=84834 RepID=UPI00174B059A|nr:splicing factor, proline- and glutamine-rich-like [Molothrus ater]
MRAALFRDNFIPCQALVALPGPGRAPSGAVGSLPPCLFSCRPSLRTPRPGRRQHRPCRAASPVPGRAEPRPRRSRAPPHGARHRGPAPLRPALPGTARHGFARNTPGSGPGGAETSGAVPPNAAGGAAGPAPTAPPGPGHWRRLCRGRAWPGESCGGRRQPLTAAVPAAPVSLGDSSARGHARGHCPALLDTRGGSVPPAWPSRATRHYTSSSFVYTPPSDRVRTPSSTPSLTGLKDCRERMQDFFLFPPHHTSSNSR